MRFFILITSHQHQQSAPLPEREVSDHSGSFFLLSDQENRQHSFLNGQNLPDFKYVFKYLLSSFYEMSYIMIFFLWMFFYNWKKIGSAYHKGLHGWHWITFYFRMLQNESYCSRTIPENNDLHYLRCKFKMRGIVTKMIDRNKKDQSDFLNHRSYQ